MPKSLKRITKDINKGGKKALKTMARAGAKLGEITNDEILPAVKTIGIPIASTAMGMAGEYLGGPLGGIVSEKLTSNLLEQNIKGQSKNKYVKLLGDALGQAGKSAITGEFDPNEAFDTGMSFIGNKDLSRRTRRNPDNPYEDVLTTMLKDFPQEQSYQSENVIHANENIDEPFEQREGSKTGLLGAGLKKKKKKKSIDSVVKVEVIKKLPHQKFSHAKNSSLDQLLEATKEKELKEAQKEMKEMVNKQKAFLTAQGYGLYGKGNLIGLLGSQTQAPINPEKSIKKYPKTKNIGIPTKNDLIKQRNRLDYNLEKGRINAGHWTKEEGSIRKPERVGKSEGVGFLKK